MITRHSDEFGPPGDEEMGRGGAASGNSSTFAYPIDQHSNRSSRSSRVSYVHPRDEDVVDEEGIRKAQKRKKMILICILLMVLICIIIGVVVVVSGDKQTAKETIAAEGGTIEDVSTEAPSIQLDEKSKQFLVDVQDIVAPLSTNPEVFEESSSSQSNPLFWLALNDFEPIFGNPTIEGMLSAEMESRIISRYALAVLYFSTSGKDNDSWNNQFNFLSEGVHECDWNDGSGMHSGSGVFCDSSSGHVTRLAIGKLMDAVCSESVFQNCSHPNR